MHRFAAGTGLRFIPAGAGNTIAGLTANVLDAVHPRGRGEHAGHAVGAGGGVGSSPRARGTRRRCRGRSQRRRFIPAGAGNTRPPAARSRQPSVHPRGRGEHGVWCPNSPPRSGSSPRARGTPPSIRPSSFHIRFIPAGAGNTRSRDGESDSRAVHPRGRGEHLRRQNVDQDKFGSSPRARGTLYASKQRSIGCRFIPAGAGNTIVLLPSQLLKSVHPRGRGEHHRQHKMNPPPIGSSPRARGTQRPIEREGRAHRFIPAGAGNTHCHTAGAVRSAVHPRGRGEHNCNLFHVDATRGSSPRARGTHHRLFVLRRPRRFIPAGAGNTYYIVATGMLLAVHPRGRGEHFI